MEVPLETRIRSALPKSLDDAIVEYIVSLLKENISSDENYSTDPKSLENDIGPFLEGCDVQIICKNISAILPAHKQPARPASSKVASAPSKAAVMPASAKASAATTTATPFAAPALVAPAEVPTNPIVTAASADSEEDIVSVYGCGGTRGRFPPGLSKDVNISIDITVRNTDLLVSAPLRLIYGHRYGLVGKNGIGKSTLLDRLARGAVAGFPPHLRVLHVKQEILGDARSALAVVEQSDEEVFGLQQEEKKLLQEDSSANASRLADIYKRLEELDIGTTAARAKAVLKSFGFSDAQMQKPTERLSGGWRMRVALACAKYLEPDVLLLDEPTNHLDLESVLWLQAVLIEFTGTLVVVSHDRSFLQFVCTDVIHFHKRTLTNYPCKFLDFLRVREEKLKKKAKLQEELDKKREQLEKSITKMTQIANKNERDQKRMGQVASRKKKLLRLGLEKTEDGKKWNCQKMGGGRIGSINMNGGGWKGGKRTAASVIELPDPSFDFEFPSAESLGTHRAILTMDDVSFTYAGAAKPQLKGVNLRLDADSRLVVLGMNGSGKSTLLNLITGDLEPTSGLITRHQNLRVAHFTQHHVHSLDFSLSPLQHLSKLDPQASEQSLRAHLGSYGLHGNIALQKIGSLSGGQKARVVFATITLRPPHLLVLDEPSNHLDFDTIEALTVALTEFEGAIILVTHDAYVIESLGEGVEMVYVANNRVTPWTESFDDYKIMTAENEK